MGVWSSTLFGSGGMIQWQRWQGTLELGVGGAAVDGVVYLPFSLANSFTGMYALVATLLWGRLLFGVPLHFAHPWLFALVAAGDGARARADGAPAGVELHPLPLRERALEPARVPGLDRDRAALPDRAAARLDAADLVGARRRTGASHAIRHAALGGDVWLPIAMVTLLGLAYLALGAFTFRLLRARARARATLSLT